MTKRVGISIDEEIYKKAVADSKKVGIKSFAGYVSYLIMKQK